MKCVIVLCLLHACMVWSQTKITMKSVKEWNQLDFNFPSQQDRQNAIDNGLFVQANAFPIDMDVDYNVIADYTRIFVTIPRFSVGVPVTLGTIAAATGSIIQPYPDYAWHSSHGTNCDGITSVVRIAIDECRRLWVLDTGKIAETQHCPPQILIFDLNSNQLIKRYRFPKSQYKDASLFITPILDVKDPAPFGQCSNTKAYIADVTGFAIIVYDFASDKSWRVENKLFEPVAAFGTFSIAGESFDLMDGIFGMTLQKRRFDSSNNLIFGNTLNGEDNRVLFFHALASNTENTIPLSILNNAQAARSNANIGAFKTIGTREAQAPAEAMDSNGNLFFVLTSSMALACWDSSTPYTQNNIQVIYRNDATLQFASGLKIVKNILGQDELWILTNRFQKISAGTINANEVNYRIQARTVNALLRGNNKCNNGLTTNFAFPTK